MPDEARLLLAFAISIGVAYAATPRAIALATRADFHDRPRPRAAHLQPTPYLGGAAVVAAFLLASVTAGGELSRLTPIVVCAFGLWVLGTLDDRASLPAWLRLSVEGLAAIVLWTTGLGWELFVSDGANLALTVLWTLGLVNALNFMDNMDGAAATVAAVTGIAVAVLAALEGDAALAALACGLAGACLGFLPYNLARPSRIFLGDGGSLPIGFLMAGTIMALPEGDGAGLPRLLAAVLLAGLPVVDTCLVLISRWRARVPVLHGGYDHLTHRLLTRLGSARVVAGALGAAQAALGAVAIGVAQQGGGSIVVAWTLWFFAAAAGVALLESRSWIPVREARGEEGEPPAPMPAGLSGSTPSSAARTPQPEGGRSPSTVEVGLIGFLGGACGLSPFLYGFYNLSVWGPIGLLLLAVLVGLVFARPASLRPVAVAAVAGLVAVWLWSVLSSTWAESSDQALASGNRWMLYSALFGVLVLLIRDDRLAGIVLGVATAAVLALAGYVVLRMAAGDGASLFVEGRLNDPLNYINGEAGYLLLGLWPLVVVAERSRNPAAAGAAVAAAVVLLGLVVLTQTRAVVPAAVVSAAVVILIFPGRARRLWIVLLVAGGAAACSGPLLEVFDSTGGSGLPDNGVVREAALALLVTGLLTGVAWATLSSVAEAASRRPEGVGSARRVAAIAPFALVAVLAIGALAAVGDPVDKTKEQYRAFKDLEGEGDRSSRFTTGSGNRYDYWRVAWSQFADAPIRGIGAGNYDTTYYRERRTDENITQPHSMVFQSLAELGLVGTLCLLLFVGAVLVGLGSRALKARADTASAGIGVAAGGAFLVFLVQASVDWVHLIPGITGLALCAAACLVGPWRPAAAGGGPAPRRRAVAVIGCGLLAVGGAVLLGRATLADQYRTQSEDALVTDPRRALDKADDSLALSGDSLPGYYARAAALARLDRYEPARAALLEATRREPSDYVPWALLGDLAVRRADFVQAREDYGRAADLNSQDSELKGLAENPRGGTEP